jgi:signal transduction histidine kinase/ligand-binding sensor domain-containing protein
MRFGAPFTRGSTAPPRASKNWLAAFMLNGLLCGLALAQYRFDNWTTEHGLPQNSVEAITQRRDGYLWLTTLNGLVRFDGVRFTLFAKSETPGMGSSRCNTLCEDAEGALWIGTENSGVMRYWQGRFTTFTTRDGLPHNLIRRIQRARNGEVLITTLQGSVWWRNGRFVPEGPQGRDFYPIYLSPAGAYWSLDRNGLHEQLQGQTRHYALALNPQEDLARIKFHEDRAGSLWVSTPLTGVFKAKNGVLENYSARLGLPLDTLIWEMVEDRSGYLWLASAELGLLRFKDGAPEKARAYTTADGLASNSVRSLYLDREGTLWFGSSSSGLNRLTPQFITGYSSAQGLAGDVAHGVLEDRAGNVWVCTHSGLSKITNGVLTNYKPVPATTPGITKGLPVLGLYALHEDRAGRLWLGGDDGLCWLEDGVFTLLLRGQIVWAIYEDSQGNLWYGTLDHGLFKLRDGVMTSYTTKDGLPHNSVRAIYEDRHGVLWFGTDGGLVKYQAGQFVTLTNQDGPGTNRVWSIYEDAEGVFWFGTYEGGLFRLKAGRFTNYTKAKGLFDNGVFQILEDGRGNLWMSCFRNLYSVSKQQLNDYADGKISTIISQAYGKSDGMLNPNCNGGRQPSGVKTRDGRLWFTTLKGVAVVKADAVPVNPLPPPVLIESASLDRAVANISDGLRVAPHQANLEIGYTALSFIRAEQVRFKYRLLGQDPDWIEAGTRRTAHYSYLRPGQYTFKVIAANSDGVWNNEGAQLPIVVLPAFYQTWWFRLLALLASAGSIGLIFKQRLDRAHRARQAQEDFSRRLIESQEQERKRIAAELHDSLGQNLLIIKNRALLGALSETADAAAKEEFAEISASAGQAIEETRHIAYNLRPYNLERLGLTNTIEEMIEDVAKTSGIRFTADLLPLDGALQPEAEINLYRVLQECVNNIVKHSGASEAVVEINRDPQYVFIKIADNGRGFSMADGRLRPADAGAAKAASRSNPQSAIRNPPSGGFGLLGLAERVRLLNGELTIDSAAGQGTTIQIKIALPAAGLL